MQLLLIVPFMRFGELMLRAPALDIKPAKLWDLFHDPGEGLKAVGHALLGWVVVIIPAGVLLTLVLTPCFAFLKRKCAPSLSECVVQEAIVNVVNALLGWVVVIVPEGVLLTPCFTILKRKCAPNLSWSTLQAALNLVGHALLGWIVLVIPAGVLLTLALTPCFAFFKRKCVFSPSTCTA